MFNVHQFPFFLLMSSIFITHPFPNSLINIALRTSRNQDYKTPETVLDLCRSTIPFNPSPSQLPKAPSTPQPCPS